MSDKLSEFWQDYCEIIVLLLIAFLIFAIISCGVVKFAEASCINIAEKMELDYDWSFFTGCMVRINDRWIPLEYWRNIDINLQNENEP